MVFAKATDRGQVIRFVGDGVLPRFRTKKGEVPNFWVFPLKYSGERVDGEQLQL
ncbi:MAG: hypothetical protein AAF575_02505 [Bacteroidota bacterium]